MEELRERSKKLYEDIEWDDPIEIDSFGPEWPGSILPGMEPWIDCVSQDLQVPKGMVALALLAGISVAVRRRLYVQVKSTWSEPFNVYTMTVAASGETKTPTLKRIMAPLARRELELRAAVSESISTWSQENKVIKKRLAHYTNRVATCEDPSQMLALNLFLEEAVKADLTHELIRPINPRLFIEDATPEAANNVMARQLGVIAVMSSEGGFVENMMGRYSKIANLNGVLKSWDGVEAMVIDRVGKMDEGSDGTIIVPRPYLTIGLMVQPRVLEVLGGSDDVIGKGLPARFLFCVPNSRIGDRLTDPVVDWTGVLTWDAIEERIEESLAGIDNQAPFAIPIEFEAAKTFKTMRERWEVDRRPNGRLSPILDWSNKLGSHVARVAGAICLLRMMTTGGLTWMITEEDMHQAWAFSEWEIEHALAAHKVMGSMSGGARSKLGLVLAAMKDVLAGGGKSVTHVDLRKRLRNVVKTDELFTVMTIAERRRWVEIRNPSMTSDNYKHSEYVINPKIASL